MPVMIPVHCRKHLQWACEYQNIIMEQWKKVARWITFSFRSDGWLGACVSFNWGRDGSRMHYGSDLQTSRLHFQPCSITPVVCRYQVNLNTLISWFICVWGWSWNMQDGSSPGAGLDTLVQWEEGRPVLCSGQ